MTTVFFNGTKIEVENGQVFLTDKKGNWQKFNAEHFGADANDSNDTLIECVKDWLETNAK